MRRARTTKDPGAFFNLDSLMDIVTNVLGALFFVVVFVVLSSAGATGWLITPLAAQADTEGVTLECRGNTVIFPGYDTMLAQVNRTWDQAVKEGLDWDARVERMRGLVIGNRYGRYEPSVGLRMIDGSLYQVISHSFTPYLDSLGENEIELKRPDADFRRRLRSLDPKRYHVYFLTRGDSYEVFHVARKLAMSMGFRAGWDPIDESSSVSYSSSGIGGAGDVQ